MIFSKKTKLIFYTLVIGCSTYIGYILGNAFCLDNCSFTIFLNILITNLVTLLGLYVLINLSEKSITEWNEESSYEEE
ncbi:MAG: hypothetical protein EVA29_01595 [Candidatus Actinomarinales bacterium]|nr:MAG: hypothetical protein EVA29_01595 [Candidatus Actinomarinales bacterium]|tara:strand:+ start:2272 stop:2505 length:234 start_codon:yes stop_codon:yes gene_type:complete